MGITANGNRFPSLLFGGGGSDCCCVEETGYIQPRLNSNSRFCSLFLPSAGITAVHPQGPWGWGFVGAKKASHNTVNVLNDTRL